MLRKILSAAALIIAVIYLTTLARVPLAWAQEVSATVQAKSTESSEPRPSGGGEADQASLRNLVQRLIDARLNYGENLHILVEFYEKNGNIQRGAWAKRELDDFRRIDQHQYLPGLQPRLILTDLADCSESDIVEALVECRQTYRQSLESLIEVLKNAKEVPRWLQAKGELKDLISVNKYLYLRDADTPSGDLQPREQISQADELYNQALQLKKESQPALTHRYKTQLAIEAFRQLIRDYPTSDKIDEAAYQIAEICRENLQDYQRAICWYECVLAWEPQSQLPVNYRLAQIYDKKLVNRLAALSYYQRALQQTPRGSSEHRDIQKRIDKLRGK